jgi:hypothetical protein
MADEQPPSISAEQIRRELADTLLDQPEHAVRGVEAILTGPSADTDYERVGIVFVHGVGSQRKGDALREFGTPLIDWVEEWHRDRSIPWFRVVWSDLIGNSTEPAAAGLILPSWTDPDTKLPHPGQVWVMTEAWWASRVEPPPFSTMVGWASKRLVRLFTGLFAGALAAARRPLYGSGWPGRSERFFQVVNALGITLVYGLAQVLLYVLLVLLAVVAALPVPGLDRLIFVRLARPLLTNNVGDFYVCLYDRLQAIDIRQSIFEAVSWLARAKRCSRVMVAAHSGGTVVAIDALGTTDVLDLGKPPASISSQLEKVTTLITFGAALNAAWDEKRATSEYKPARDMPDAPRYTQTAWFNFWTHFDWALPGRGLDRGPARSGKRRFSFPVTNALSPVSDHGGYFANFEEFISRLAQEADSPSSVKQGTEYTHSRFWPGEATEAARVWERYARVATLTWWRFGAVSAVVLALLGRYGLARHDAVADASALWMVVPIIGRGSAALAISASTMVWLPLLLVAAAVMVAAYGLWVSMFFVDWHLRASRVSARPPKSGAHVFAEFGSVRLTQSGEIGLRTVGFTSFIALMIAAFASALPFGDMLAPFVGQTR